MKYLYLLLFLLSAAFRAQAGGNEVVVIYNSQLPQSKAIAEHYASVRNVPASQVFGIGLTTNEIMSRADFTDFLQKPLAERLESAGLWKFGDVEIPANGSIPSHTEHRIASSKIRYAVLCWGIPLKIAPGSILDEMAGKLKGPSSHRDEASVDSELSWLPLLRMAEPIQIGGPLPNPLYGCTNRDMLSPTNGLLLVARLDGPTPEIANALVDKAIAAETNGLFGRAYFDTRAEPTNSNYYLGDFWMSASAEICRQVGFDVTVDTNASTFPASFPMSQIAIYAGWYDSDVSGPFTRPKVEFMPGAFAYHLHSFSAETLRTTGSHWCGPLLARGATCTMGSVYEPYLQFTPNIAVFIRGWMTGYTFGEAAWSSQMVLSWQNTVIGDPLYQPFKLSLEESHARLAHDHSPLLEWTFERLVNLDRARGARDPQLEKLLEGLPITPKSAVLTEKLADLYDSLGKPTSAITSWQAALKLNPSPEQRIRIRRTLTAKLIAANRNADAIQNDQQLLAESPDYPGRAQVEAELKSLTPNDSAANKK